MDWESLNWPILDRLRETFLNGVSPGMTYWTSREDLANYDFTFAQRIAWKWDAVLAELNWRQWHPPPGHVLDWGCGSGIAGRRVIESFGASEFASLRVFDHSAVAMDYALSVARESFPKFDIQRAEHDWLSNSTELGLLVVSHVLNELSSDQRQSLLALACRAQAVLWLEPGTHSDSRQLIAVHEALLSDFEVIAPCTHQTTCGLLASENAHHWCHHFARPPFGIMGDSNWVRFAQRAGIDLRSLPYSFLVLQKKETPQQTSRTSGNHKSVEGHSRIIGRPRVYKAYARIFSCQQDGVRDLTLQKRDHAELFKAIKKGRQDSIYQWEVLKDRITKATSASETKRGVE